ncbi:MAG: hydrogenase maturation protease, partial [Nocardioidaceae bacterium]
MTTDHDGASARTVLVAGIGNIFFRDDGFGPEVVRRLAEDGPDLPAGVRVVDYGIRGMHLAFDLLDDVTALVLVDAVPGTAAAGSLQL